VSLPNWAVVHSPPQSTATSLGTCVEERGENAGPPAAVLWAPYCCHGGSQSPGLDPTRGLIECAVAFPAPQVWPAASSIAR
jgi:hypothetical protein